MTFWAGAATLILIALSFLIVPWWRERRRDDGSKVSGLVTALAIVPVSVGLYLLVTSYDPEAARQSVVRNEQIALLEQLAARLGENPDDVQGWMLLGRSYRTLQDYDGARLAFEEAWKRTEMPDATLKLLYAESLLFSDPSTAEGRAGELIDEVLESSPDNQSALWLGGIVAVERGDTGLAAERFTALLATNPPPEIADIVRRQLVAMTGSAPATPPADDGTAGPVIDVEIRVADGMMPAAVGPDSYVYLFARAAAGGPPIAARQIAISELPGRFELSDADAMIAGRSLAGQGTVTVVARISVSGQPIEQPGDAYGEVEVDPESEESVSLTIDRIVPSA